MIFRLTALITLAAILLTGVSCDSHSWEETRVLHGHGASHGKGAHATDDHGKKADHADLPAGEGEKKAH